MLFVIEDITENTYKSILEAYNDGIRDFQLEINSYGGSFNSALRIYDLLRGDAENNVSARVSGNCMSAATILLLCAPKEKRRATKNSVFMCHSPLLSYMGDINKTTADNLKEDIDRAYNQLKSIYFERTDSKDVIDDYMRDEKSFYADEAFRLGFIGEVEEMYNKSHQNKFSIMKKSYLKQLINRIVSGLKNEVVKTKDGNEFEVVAVEVGAPANVADGVYELEDGTVITVETGVIVDIVTPVVETEEVENEGEETEETEEETVETKEDVVETVTEVVEQVEEAVTEEEVAEIVETAIEELKEEIINKYAPMVKLVNELGGMKKLQTLKNVKKDKKNFVSEEPKKRTLSDIMDKIR